MFKELRVFACLLAATAMPQTAIADLYDANEAYRKPDFDRSFELYRELAELGRREAQETLAVMYVNGEGVKRDNVLGYAWAVIAQEHGESAAMQNIVTQLDPHMTPAARDRVKAVQAEFGAAALRERLLPATDLQAYPASYVCNIRAPVNPEAYYPPEAVRKGISGSVDIDVEVAPNGSPRSVKVVYSLPEKWFDEAGRRIALDVRYTAPTVNGRKAPCRIRYRVKFGINGQGVAATPEQQKVHAEVRAKALSGDPVSELNYGLLLDTNSGIAVDGETALTWFLKAAQAGIPAAQYLVGRQLLTTPASAQEKATEKGLAWLQRAADAGQPEAQAALANYLLRHEPDAETLGKAQDLLEKSAAAGSADGKYDLAAVLATGPDAARRDPRRALALIDDLDSEVKLFPSSFEIRAAAKAMLGDYAGAKQDQSKALRMAKALQWNVKDQQARLASYEASKPWTGNLFAY